MWNSWLGIDVGWDEEIVNQRQKHGKKMQRITTRASENFTQRRGECCDIAVR